MCDFKIQTSCISVKPAVKVRAVWFCIAHSRKGVRLTDRVDVFKCNWWCHMWGSKRGGKPYEDKSLKYFSHQLKQTWTQRSWQCLFYTIWSSTSLTTLKAEFSHTTSIFLNYDIRNCLKKNENSIAPPQIWSVQFTRRIDFLLKKLKRDKGGFHEESRCRPPGHDPSWCENEESSIKISKYVKKKTFFYFQCVQLCTVSYIWQISEYEKAVQLIVCMFDFFNLSFSFVPFCKSSVYYANLALVIMIEVFI